MSGGDEGIPGRLGVPPDDLVSTSLPIIDVRSPWFRCHRSGRDAIHFGRGATGRFSDPLQAFGVLYVGLDPQGAFIEAFGGGRKVPQERLESRTVSSLVTSRPARAVDLSGRNLSALGMDARISSGEHSITQVWSRAFHDHPDCPDGLLYRSRRDPSRLVLALYERDGWPFDVTPLSPATLLALIDFYGLAIV